MVVIRASSVVVDDDAPVHILVGFEHAEADFRQYLILQRSYEFDDQDIELGMNDVYIERDDQLWSAYGGILHFGLKRDRVAVKLGVETAARLGGESEYEIQFDVDDQQFSKLREGLNMVFKDFGCYVDET